MARAAVLVRDARQDDMPMLLELWAQLREQLPRRVVRTGSSETTAGVAARFAEILADPASRLVVAEADDDIVGMAVFREAPASALVDAPMLEVSHVCVRAGSRHKGVGKALLAASAVHAEDLGVDQIVASVFPQHREANRFYARLGFAPVAVRRVVPVALLRRRLNPTAEGLTALRRDLRLPHRRPRRPLPTPEQTP